MSGNPGAKPTECGRSCLHSCLLARRYFDRFPNTLVCSATADVARHRGLDLIVCGFRFLLQQRCCVHDLPALAVAALRHLHLLPGLLDRVVATLAEPLDGRDLLPYGSADGCDTASGGFAIDVDGTGATKAESATEL